ncbi:TetR/AcrR family transcriptional regulator [Pseudomonas rhizoryzae]|uniref:TetR/AcrR family transcriptional regulator n=1 Tax=Pseudomonas rhizoryzae TaxID=2571129 RepID=UPI000736BF50|nr:TetR/AcrR family transcriptional regulator [Pseudomonas rhizoryzae]KTT33261.1 TetR family transcriptional regulator [Pseudomonas psychrotolerans]KTT77286.1 TetR family transcriptional regulator [Pseudomonas psychrotolerans]
MAAKDSASSSRATPKARPSQQRAAETYERILAAAAEVLCEVGIERLSTNLVCECAGLTPPALYRYFPNKYALLEELGRRLLEKQNAQIAPWIDPALLAGPLEPVEEALTGLLLDTYRVTAETPGGMWILKALRAVPSLEHVRLDSHRRVAAQQAELLRVILPTVPAEEIAQVSRIVVELIHSTVELLFDEELPAQSTCRTVSAMLTGHLQRLRGG